jgi:TonB-dependent starch-binding outer membrane protein SusC
MKLKLLCTILAAWAFLGISAQQVIVTGVVTDAKDGSTMPGVNVVIEGTTQGTVTDLDGKYSLKVDNANAVLSFSFLGYITQKIPVGSQTSINAQLVEELTKLEEIVVIGYGTVKKSDATGSVAAVTSKDFNKGLVGTPQELIAGKVAGVVITSNDGSPMGELTMRIRGGSSLNASNDPLIVIDGVPVDNAKISGSSNPLLSINPNDIESFNILKDASATAIYGARAANGVIMIITKKGTKDLKISYSSRLSISQIPKTISVLSADEFRKIVQERYDTSISKLLGTANTNWQDKIYQSAFSNDQNITFSNSLTKKAPYRVSLGYTNNEGILKTNKVQRYTASLNFNPKLFNDLLSLNINTKAAYSDINFGNTDAIGAAVRFDPTQPVMNGNTRWGGYTTWTVDHTIDGEAQPLGTQNPVALLDLTSNTSVVKRSISNIQGDLKVPGVPDLHVNFNLAYDWQRGKGHKNIDSIAGWLYDPKHGGGQKNPYDETTKMQLGELFLNYSLPVKAISSKFEIMAGTSEQHFWKTKSDSTTNFSGSFVNKSQLITKTEYYIVSYYGRFNYNLLDRYLLTFTLRRDGTSRFSPDNRWGLFPSAALAWKIKNEPFMQNLMIFSDLKLRLGYGVTGQQDVLVNSPKENYPYLPTYTQSTSNTGYFFGNTLYKTYRPNAYDANIKWEETVTSNIGIDVGILNNRITSAIDYYFRKTSDLINDVPISAGTNFSNSIFSNIGNMENKGIEFTIDAKIISTRDVTWAFNYNIAYNSTKITKLTLRNDPSYIGNFDINSGISGGVGSKIQIYTVGYPPSSFFALKQVYDSKGNPIEGVYVRMINNGKAVSWNDQSNMYRYKKKSPDALMGISSSLLYKDWTISCSGRISLGNYVYNNVASNYGVYYNLYHANADNLENIVSQANRTKFVNAQYFSDFYIENASFFRMDNITLGYNFNNVTSKKLNIYLNISAQNVFVITNYHGLDPEVSNGIDNNFYPRPRTYLFGCNVEF